MIDNLDEYKVAHGLLPINGPGKHTIITTRNPKVSAIPAEPLEVPLLGVDDSVDLLLMLSNISPQPTYEQREQVREIVEELGYLPLAMLHAAAYVREVTRDFVTYSDAYSKNRKALHRWPTGDPQYPHSVATTWSMSFDVLRTQHPPAARFLQLFSFLNPDEILIDFLLSGAEALDNDLQQILSSESEMATILIELEKFSLIKWDRSNKLISIHRLVQRIVCDEMSYDDQTLTMGAMIDLCSQAFPEKVNNDTRQLCWVYQNQVVGPLLRLKSVLRTRKIADIKERVGNFLVDDGKYNDSEKLLLQALEISAYEGGNEDPHTLRITRSLARTYMHQERNLEAPNYKRSC